MEEAPSAHLHHKDREGEPSKVTHDVGKSRGAALGSVRDAVSMADVLDKRLHFLQVMSRQLREEVVLDLVLETTMEPLIIPIYIHVTRGLALVCEEPLGALLLSSECLSKEVADEELDVEDAADPVRCQYEGQTSLPALEAACHTAVPEPENSQAKDIGKPTDSRSARGAENKPLESKERGDDVEVEASHKQHERHKGEVLNSHEIFGQAVQSRARHIEFLHGYEPDG